jgi:hypothetical protein
VLHVYSCVAAVSSADCLVKLCSVLALAATVTEYVGYFFTVYVESDYKNISFAPHFCGFLPFSVDRSPDNWSLFCIYFWRFCPFVGDKITRGFHGNEYEWSTL